ncbi:MAG: hypothetical protein Q9222_006046 [Ikaeria aurantiellina]
MQTWSRHEKEDHEDISFPCMPDGAIEVTLRGRQCALCGGEPTEQHLSSHNIERCTQLKHVFKRTYELKQHLETHGLPRKSRQSDMLVSKWQRVPDKQAWACGFCRATFPSLATFHKHVASEHYQRGEDRKWDHTKVILGLLSQPHIAGPWERLLAARFRTQTLSCKWSKKITGCLQLRLELGREPGEVLAEAALECAIYDRSLLHDVFRQNESPFEDAKTNSGVASSGPPVPPKPLSVRSSSHDGSISKNQPGQDIVTQLTCSPVDQFKIQSPPFLDVSPAAWEAYMASLDHSHHPHQNAFDQGIGLDVAHPMDIDVDQSLGFASPSQLANLAAQRIQHSGQFG